MEFNEKDDELFKVFEGSAEETKAEKENSRVRCWVGTWNNPKYTDEEFLKHFQSLEEQEILQYAIFQREIGKTGQNIHFQFFVIFKNKQYFSKIKKELLPYGCHFAPMRSNETYCKHYCSKSDTRISGPYQVGEFITQGTRTDLFEAIKMIEDGLPFELVEERFPTQSLMYNKSLREKEQRIFEKNFKTNAIPIEITFIYGPPRSGKTTFVNSQVDFDFTKIFVVENYGDYMFTGYTREPVILFDEFIGQVKPIAKMNKLLEPFPKRLNVKNDVVQAAYSKVFIVSNYSLSQLYPDCREEQLESFKAFCERIHRIIRFDKDGTQHIERDSVWENIPPEEQKIPGLNKRVKETYQIDKNGKKHYLYQRQSNVQVSLEELPVVETVDLPW